MIVPNDTDKCFCNSNKAYCDCCKPLVEKYEFLELFRLSNEYNKDNNTVRSLKYLLAAYTSYMIEVKKHTLNPKLTNGNLKQFLVEVDINALRDLLDRLMYLIVSKSIEFDFISFLKKSKEDFYIKKWHEVINYFIVHWYYICHNDKDKAVRFIEYNVNVKKVEDVKFIDMLADVYSEKLTTIQHIDLYDKLIESAENNVLKCNYIMRKALRYLSLNDADTYKVLIRTARELCDESYNDELNYNEKYMCAKVYSLSGKDNVHYIHKAIDIYKNIAANISQKNDNMMYWHIANDYFEIKDYSQAITYYIKAKEANCTNEILIELARAYIRNSDYGEGEKVLLEVDVLSLNNELKMDYLTAYSELCCYIETGKIDYIISELKLIEEPSNYYSEYIKETIIMLYEIKSNNGDTLKKTKWIKKWNKILMIKPNFFGLGIDVNEAIDAFTENKV